MANLVAAAETSVLGDAHGLVVGIANYQHINALPTTVLDDARDVHDVLTDPDYGAYPPENVGLLLDEAATGKAMRDGLVALADRSTETSTVCLYVSSHGGRIQGGAQAGEYLLPVDVDYSSDDALAASAISGQELTEALRAIPARKLVVMFDCCHSGGIGQPKDAVASPITALSEAYYATLATGFGRVILASSRSNEFSYVLPNQPNSVFTQHLLAALRGGAPAPGGVIRILDVFTYLQPRVTADQPSQHPIMKAEIEDNFPVALYLGGKAAAPAPSLTPQLLDAARSTDGHLPYDVFISYRTSEPDASWVRRVLRPRLEAAGFKVITEQDFRLGEPIVLETARAVEQSRRTLAILTEAYLDSGFTEMESVLAEQLGDETRERRLLAVIRQPVKPRLGIRALKALDMTDDRSFEVDVQRLVYGLAGAIRSTVA